MLIVVNFFGSWGLVYKSIKRLGLGVKITSPVHKSTNNYARYRVVIPNLYFSLG
ncbi:hypothetical protein BABINDRAFT_75403 [Babjeviella inositovora NRRL Y-12698]|uniref:Uncharacterized protein n=1 Tax=Babjeviella inositovora NRRL Y-12698 TaxID=984486 RepID=A0A1E3QYI2_9ASCO|nr:uncharacterized protein BABINDRAFT_75403 [Babjeviella inositovora NRRL Y-12698]ODQ82713.1 hypothetical protein BABINDRAFT_75403 [Babjeviella inositovora NRRL Y-12698]